MNLMIRTYLDSYVASTETTQLWLNRTVCVVWLTETAESWISQLGETFLVGMAISLNCAGSSLTWLTFERLKCKKVLGFGRTERRRRRMNKSRRLRKSTEGYLVLGTTQQQLLALQKNVTTASYGEGKAKHRGGESGGVTQPMRWRGREGGSSHRYA